MQCHGKCGATKPGADTLQFWCPDCKKEFNAYLGPKGYRDYWTLDLYTFAREARKLKRLKDGFKTLKSSGDR